MVFYFFFLNGYFYHYPILWTKYICTAINKLATHDYYFLFYVSKLRKEQRCFSLLIWVSALILLFPIKECYNSISSSIVLYPCRWSICDTDLKCSKRNPLNQNTIEFILWCSNIQWWWSSYIETFSNKGIKKVNSLSLFNFFFLF